VAEEHGFMTEYHIDQSQDARDGEVSLGDLVRVLWEGKWLIVAITTVAMVSSVVIALLLPNVYRAETLLAPNQQESSGSLASLAAQYGGLASLAGINLADGDSSKTVLGLEVLKSRKFVGDFIERHDILVPLMAAKSWDPETGGLLLDESDYDVASMQWIRRVKPPMQSKPSRQEAYKEFMEILTVSEDKKTGFVTVAIDFFSPELAKQWVDWLIEDINATVMQNDVSEAEQAINYLNAQVARTSLADMRNVFFRLIEEQTKTVMLAKVSDEYLLKTIDPAVVPELKVKPKRKLIVILGFLLGGIIGVSTVFFRKSFSPESR